MSKSETISKKPIIINNLNALIEKIHELEKEIAQNQHNYFFRGQANSKWKLNSSWRRKSKNNMNMKDSLVITFFHKKIQLIKGYGYKQRTTLELLTEMQHNNIPTFLIDFTSNIYHALWFAFSDNSPEANKGNNAKIFILNNEDNKSENELDLNLLSEQNEFPNSIFNASIFTKRAITQKSYFICDKKNKNFAIKCWEIKRNHDNIVKILGYLYNKGISARTIYPDLLGTYKETEIYSATWYFFQAFHSKWRKIKITNYTYAIELNSKFKEAYNYRGMAFVDMMMFEKGIADYTKAIEIDDKYKEAYSNRAHAYFWIQQLWDAIHDYTKAIEIEDNWTDRYNRAQIYIQQKNIMRQLLIIQWPLKWTHILKSHILNEVILIDYKVNGIRLLMIIQMLLIKIINIVMHILNEAIPMRNKMN